MPYVYAVLNGALTPKAGAAHHDEKPSIIGLISMESSMNMNPDFGSWLIGAGGGMLGMASGMFGMFIVLAATTFGAALLYAVTGFGFAVPHDATDDQIRIVERGAIGMAQRVSQLSPFVDATRRLRSDMAGDAAWE